MKFDEYEALVPPSHRYPREEGRERSRFVDLVELCLEQGIQTADMLDSFENGFSLDQAVGKQLDFLGALVGAERQLPYAILGSDGKLNDDDFRLMIRARIAANAWDGTNESLKEILRDIYSSYGVSFRDNQDMTFKYVIRGRFSDIQKQMINGDLLFPRPSGVSVSFDIIDTAVDTDITVSAVLGSDFMQAKTNPLTEGSQTGGE